MEKVIETILNIPAETQTIEFKRLNGNCVVKKIIETIVAMANTDGGFIILGIEDPEKTKLKNIDRVFGIEESKEIYDEIFHELKRIIPPFSNLKPSLFETSNNKTIAILEIEKATNSFCSVEGSVWVRLHKSNKKLTPQEVIRLSYAKGFEKADRELVDINFELLQTDSFEEWRKSRDIKKAGIEEILFQTGLARKDKNNKLKPTRASVLLFAKYPTDLMDTKCTIRVFKYKGTLEKFNKVPNLIGKPKTIGGATFDLIKEAHEYILSILESGIEIHTGFITKYKIPERTIKEAITNAVIHRDYYIKRDIEVKIFEDRVEILSPGLFSGNITSKNIGFVRAEEYRNDLLVKHLREFPSPPNLDRNEGVRAMRSEMLKQNLFPPVFITYPIIEDSVNVFLFNEEMPSEWEKVAKYLHDNKYINNKKARELTSIVQMDKMSKLFKKWLKQGVLEIIPSNSPKNIKYKLSNKSELNI